MNDNHTLKVTEDVIWTGVLDYDIVSFDIVMETRYGTTYNSYLVRAGKNALIETVKESFFEVYLNKLKNLTELSDIKYVVLNHTEPDHSGSLGRLLELIPDLVVVGTGNALRYLQDIVGKPFESMQVKDGDSLDLGNKTLRFVGAPNLHWPDTMYTYLEEDRVLFTCDSFGAHYCDDKMFDDEVGNFEEAFRYYFDVILKPYSKFMLKAIEKINRLPVKVICPGHGPILRKDPAKYVSLSETLAREYMKTQEYTARVLVAYISAYGYTAEMAEAIARGLESAGGLEVELADIEHMSLGDIENKLIRSHALIVGSPTINQNTLLPVYKLFSVINPLRDRGKPAAAFGSYGWSGEAVGIIGNMLRQLKLEVVQEGLGFKFYPHSDKLNQLENFGRRFAEHLHQKKEQDH